MSKELIERLRKEYHPKRPPLFDEAADALEAQQKRIEYLEKQLKRDFDDGSIDWRGENEV